MDNLRHFSAIPMVHSLIHIRKTYSRPQILLKYVYATLDGKISHAIAHARHILFCLINVVIIHYITEPVLK